MPQFDFFSFFVQILWLSIGTCALYLVYLRSPLKNSSEVSKMRAKIKAFNSTVGQKIKSSLLYDTILNFFFKKK